jgi:uncharacterized protein with NAD-binding domain and iron-sulfur cluster
MTKKKIAILGGGIAGLTTALELTQTPELRAKHDVTIYQLGFRLGGKLASGRNGEQRANVEHGLHVWFGFYENVFGTLKKVYAEWDKDPRGPFQTWRDVVEARSYTPIGYQLNNEWQLYPQLWFTNSDEPGDGKVELSPLGVITGLLSVLDRTFAHPIHEDGDPVFDIDVPPIVEDILRDAMQRLKEMGIALGEQAWMRAMVKNMAEVVRELDDDVAAFVARYPGPMLWVLEQFSAQIHLRLNKLSHGPGTELFDWLLADYVVTTLRGLLNPEYHLLDRLDFDGLNDTEFTQWMRVNGASQALLDSTLIRVIYETAFQYVDGDTARPDMEAGTTLRCVFRMLFTYKGAMMWELRGGMGDLFIAPIYEVLQQRGVKFELFSKVMNLGLSADKKQIDNVRIGVQARAVSGTYQPLLTLDYGPAWPEQPLWDQLENGADLQARHVDFESHWCQEPLVEERVLRQGADFDHVVLAIAIGAFKPLNAQPGPCAELIAANQRFATMAHALGLVPSQALQLWMQYDLKELGFEYNRYGIEGIRPAVVDGPDPFNIWADMTQVLPLEQWRGNRPRSVHYLCGMLKTELYKEPSTVADVPARAAALVRAEAVNWIERYAFVYWPLTSEPEFDWQVLTDPENRIGAARLDAQYFRANIDPTACCVASATGTSKHRLEADESGFDNLTLAGAWTRTPLNLECVEGAVMSGMLASRAICGHPRRVVGEFFLRMRDDGPR